MTKRISHVESYRVDTQEEVEAFIAEEKRLAEEGGYILKAYGSTEKTKKKKGEIIDEGYLVRITKEYGSFWEESYD